MRRARPAQQGVRADPQHPQAGRRPQHALAWVGTHTGAAPRAPEHPGVEVRLGRRIVPRRALGVERRAGGQQPVRRGDDRRRDDLGDQVRRVVLGPVVAGPSPVEGVADMQEDLGRVPAFAPGRAECPRLARLQLAVEGPCGLACAAPEGDERLEQAADQGRGRLVQGEALDRRPRSAGPTESRCGRPTAPAPRAGSGLR